MASIHPNSIVRWEDSPSLEHACWQCPTKANSPRALHTCYGVHSMPCVSYHPTMHAVGAAHRCSGCITAREIHDARHRNVAELVEEYRALESPPGVPETPTRRSPLVEVDANIAGDQRSGLGRAPVARNRTLPIGLDIAIHEDDEDVSVTVENEDDKIIDTTVENGVGSDEDSDDDDDDDAASISSYAPSSTATADHPTDKKKLNKAELRAEKKSKKCARSASKALKNKNRNLVVVTSADVDMVTRILHGDEQDVTSDRSAHPLATDKNIEDVMARSLGVVKNIKAHKADLLKSVAIGRKEVKDRRRLKKKESKGEAGEETIEMEQVVSAIMIKLGIDPTVVAASVTAAGGPPGISTPSKTTPHGLTSGRNRAKSTLSLKLARPSSASGSGGKRVCGGTPRARVNVAVKLRAAIKSDLEKHENEVHARYVRAGAFWRYVGKTVFERMTEIARRIDVATGEIWEKKWAREGKAEGVDNNHDEDHLGQDE